MEVAAVVVVGVPCFHCLFESRDPFVGVEEEERADFALRESRIRHWGAVHRWGIVELARVVAGEWGVEA